MASADLKRPVEETEDSSAKKPKVDEPVVLGPSTTRQTAPLSFNKQQDFLRLRGSLQAMVAMMEKGLTPSRLQMIQCGLLPNCTLEQVQKALTGAQKMITLYNLDGMHPRPGEGATAPAVGSAAVAKPPAPAPAAPATVKAEKVDTEKEEPKAVPEASAKASPPPKEDKEEESVTAKLLAD